MASGCLAEDAGGEAGTAEEGLPPDASQEDFVAALENIEPIELTMQAPSSPGDPGSHHIEEFGAALEEWSGGSITTEIAYGNAVADPDQAINALADGRLGMDYIYPVYDPTRYPAAGEALSNASVLGYHDPVAGTLSTMAGFLDVALDSEEVMQDTESDGVKTLIPWGGVSGLGLMCTDPVETQDDLAGAQVRAGSTVVADQVEALGAAPVSMQYGEVYQALQRGTLDCAAISAWAGMPLDLMPLAPNYLIDSEIGFGRQIYGLGVGEAQWETMPLAAQQLIYDRVDVWLQEITLVSIWSEMEVAAEQMDEAGGEINGFDDDMTEALTEANEEILDDVRESEALDGEALVNDLETSLDEWQDIVSEDLGYPQVEEADFVEWYQEEGGDIDLEPFMDRLREDVLNDHRPQ